MSKVWSFRSSKEAEIHQPDGEIESAFLIESGKMLDSDSTPLHRRPHPSKTLFAELIGSPPTSEVHVFQNSATRALNSVGLPRRE
jgi:hypothetical protein